MKKKCERCGKTIFHSTWLKSCIDRRAGRLNYAWTKLRFCDTSCRDIAARERRRNAKQKLH